MTSLIYEKGNLISLLRKVSTKLESQGIHFTRSNYDAYRKNTNSNLPHSKTVSKIISGNKNHWNKTLSICAIQIKHHTNIYTKNELIELINAAYTDLSSQNINFTSRNYEAYRKQKYLPSFGMITRNLLGKNDHRWTEILKICGVPIKKTNKRKKSNIKKHKKPTINNLKYSKNEMMSIIKGAHQVLSKKNINFTSRNYEIYNKQHNKKWPSLFIVYKHFQKGLKWNSVLKECGLPTNSPGDNSRYKNEFIINSVLEAYDKLNKSNIEFSRKNYEIYRVKHKMNWPFSRTIAKYITGSDGSWTGVKTFCKNRNS